MNTTRRRVAYVLLTSLVAPLSVVVAAAGVGGSPGYFVEDFEQPFFIPSPDHYAKDHTLIIGPDGRYHVFHIVGRNDEVWQDPGNEVDFGHASSPDLIHWTTHDRVIAIEGSGWRGRNVWAPHVIKAADSLGGNFLMTYTGVDSLINQYTGLAVSEDLFHWTDLSVAGPAYAPDSSWALWSPASSWSAGRDPFVWPHHSGLAMVTSAQTREDFSSQGVRGALSLALSADGRTWIDAGAPLAVHDDDSIMESAHLTENPLSNRWTLFYTRNVSPKGIYVLEADDPLGPWDLETRTYAFRGFASETFQDRNGEWMLSTFHGFADRTDRLTRGLTFDSLKWTDDGPRIERVRPFDTRWTQVRGDLGDQPSYHGGRSTEAMTGSSAESGWFWIHTADGYAGAYSAEEACATCPLDDSRTGVLRSEPFKVRGAYLDVWVGGTASAAAYLALVDSDSGARLYQASGTGPDEPKLHTWQLCELRGRDVYVEIVDDDTAGHVVVERIEERAPSAEEADCPEPGPVRLRISPNPSAESVILELAGSVEVGIMASIVDASGRLVRRLRAPSDGERGPTWVWDGRDESGRWAPSGVYFPRLVDPSGRTVTTEERIVRLSDAPSTAP